MLKTNRREFLSYLLAAGPVAATGSWYRGFAQTRSSGPARVVLDTTRTRADLDRNLLGSFLEHLGRAVYGGVYEPGSPLADANGLRKDVIDEVRTLGVPIMRYPGGNFVSGYQWLDGVGPKENRPRVLDRAWNSIETNQFGTNEFMIWCKQIGTEPLLAVNLGSGTPENAAALVEYCNGSEGTRWSDLRRKHGVSSPHNVKNWCLGNEMDGKWQIGHMTAAAYGLKASDAARQMRAVDRSVHLVACGSSGPFMTTYLEWDREVLEQCYDDVDAISLHRYYNNTTETNGDASRYLAMNLDMERQIQEIAAVCDYVRGLRKSPKRLSLSFDEWNVWYRARGGDGKRQEAPKLLEEVYNLEDALLVGGLINTLLRHADRVRIACLAQIINVIAPLMTSKERVIRQTIYYPYAWALDHARGQVMDLSLESESYEVPRLGHVPVVDVAATADLGTGEQCLLMLNRDLSNERELAVTWTGSAPSRIVALETLTGADLKAANTFEEPKRVVPQRLEAPKPGAKMTFRLPPRSYTAARLAVT
ncbi:MAG: alpha-N-arabinofuranosidase [Acidobacteria bacterium]|nr:MAG: alpha-N-arabinofuranosidase [Acidobacteriota bacterium]